jgi:hypothetical protein
MSVIDPKRTFVAKFCWDAQRYSRSELHTITLAHDHLSRSRAHHKQWVAIPELFRLDPGLLNHLRPLVGVFHDKSLELSRRVGKRHHAQVR